MQLETSHLSGGTELGVIRKRSVSHLNFGGVAVADVGVGGARGRPINAELTPAIVDAVLSLLAERGHALLTTVAVAKRAGVSTVTL